MKKHLRIRLAVLFVCATALGLAYHQARLEEMMTQSAQHLLSSLTPEQAPKTQFAFEAPDRTLWHFVPDNNFEQSARPSAARA